MINIKYNYYLLDCNTCNHLIAGKQVINIE